MIRLALALVLLAGPASAQEAVVPQMPELPEGYPPVMGEISATVGDKAAAWQTYDFSIGAFDASAWVSDDDDTGRVTLRIMAFAPGKPDQMEDRLHIVAEFGAFPSPGSPPKSVLIEVLAGEDNDGRKLTSGSTQALLVLDKFSRDGYAYGRTTGSFEATICLKRSATSPISAKCKPIRGRFDTAIQFDNM